MMIQVFFPAGRSAATTILCLVMALSLAACAGGSDTKRTGSDTQESGSPAKEGSAAKTGGGGWITLFDGGSLDGWVVMGDKKDAFYVKDGVIECNGSGGHWLRYGERTFKDFVFSLDYKISPDGNSGIFIRAREHDNPAFTGMEVQILDDHGKPPTMHSAGAIYGSITPMRNMSNSAGEWNHVEITCQGENVVVFMNGVKIIDIAMDQHESLKNRVREGYIGVQDHGNFVWFRNLKIMPL